MSDIVPLLPSERKIGGCGGKRGDLGAQSSFGYCKPGCPPPPGYPAAGRPPRQLTGGPIRLEREEEIDVLSGGVILSRNISPRGAEKGKLRLGHSEAMVSREAGVSISFLI